MHSYEDIVSPLELDDPRQASAGAHARLRELIRRGVLPAGAELSQVKLAKALGISRTPLREALRRLQQEGLIEAELNMRCKVAGFDAGDLDATYGVRLLLEALGMRLTLPTLGIDELRQAEEALAEMAADPAPGMSPEWRDAHHRFHRVFTSGAPDALMTQLVASFERADRYIFQLAQAHQPEGNPKSEADHYTIFDLVAAKRFEDAVVYTSRHLARTALMLLADIASEFEPVAIRASLSMISGGAEVRTALKVV